MDAMDLDGPDLAKELQSAQDRLNAHVELSVNAIISS